MRVPRIVILAALGCLAVSAIVAGDSLFLRDGRVLNGELVGVNGNIVDFDGFIRPGAGMERVRLNRSDILRIEFDNNGGRPNITEQRQPQNPEQRPAGLRERDVNVDARRNWNDTGVDVRPGQTIYFNANGKVRWGPGGREDGPEGEHNSPYNAARPIPGRPGAALIGRVGQGADYFFIGDDKGPVHVKSGGRLFLGINDDNLTDNSGYFRVTVFY